jgi:phosphatidylinositol glycan class A protein
MATAHSTGSGVFLPDAAASPTHFTNSGPILPVVVPPGPALVSSGAIGASSSSGGPAGSPHIVPLQRKIHRVAMVSDFFYPGFGGVEIHMYNVAQCMLRRGHKVIIITRAYDDRNGVRYTTNGLKVYYVPFVGVRLPPGTVTLPTMWSGLPLLRDIFLRERITIVHGHQTTSNLCHEALFHAGTLGLKVCFTDHSLFGFADAASIHINKVLEWSLRCVDQVICVSNTSRENTVLRAKIAPHRVSVIPNATDTASFTPPDTMRYRHWSTVGDYITIVVVTRLVYRKGSDLFVDVIPEICRRHPRIKWVIGGDGPRKPQLDRMVDKHGLHDRVKLLGALKHSEVRSVLCQGQIFLNCSLTEAFCIALIEAASCGLLCVSTGVGGVPEVLPSDMLLLAQPEPTSLVNAVEEAIRRVPRVSPWEMHENVRRMYSWDWVAERTERVFDRISSMPSMSLVERLLRYAAVGRVYGTICVCICIIDWLFLQFVEWWRPAKDVEIALDFPVKAFGAHHDSFLRDRGGDGAKKGAAARGSSRTDTPPLGALNTGAYSNPLGSSATAVRRSSPLTETQRSANNGSDKTSQHGSLLTTGGTGHSDDLRSPVAALVRRAESLISEDDRARAANAADAAITSPASAKSPSGRRPALERQ